MDTRLLPLLLPPSFEGDVDALWSSYAGDEDDPNPYGFITWLFHEGHLGGKAARAALTSGRAVLTLSPDPAALPDLITGPSMEPLGVVGRGAMGEVLVVRDRALRRTVALKRTLAGSDASPAQRAAFLAEAQITAQLDHPNIVTVHGFETADDGQMAYTMQLVHGRTLEQVIEEAKQQSLGPQSSAVDRGLDERLRIMLAICDAMAYAHENGVVHRDLKPENVMVAGHGEVLVMDWGIARLIPAERGTHELRILGTPLYMSPEQAFGAPMALEPASDQYTLGLILAELVTLKRANPGDEPIECIKAAREGKLVPLRSPSGVRKIRPELKAIIGKATQHKPARRYANVHDLAEDIRRFLRDEEVLAAPDTGVRRVERWVSRNRERALLIGVGLFALLVATGASLTAIGEARLLAAERTAEAREQALGELASITARQVRQLDAQLHRYEAVVAGITYAAEEALKRPGDQRQRIFGLDEDAVPADLAHSSFYDAGVSVTEMDIALAAGVPRDDVQEQVLQMAALGPTLRSALVRGSGVPATDDSKAALGQVRDGGLPVIWTYVATEAGIIANFPGTDGGYPDDYDHRTRGWYEIAKDTSGPVWNMLDIDESDMGLLLTVSEGLYDDEGNFLGVAAVDVAFPYLITKFLDAPELKGSVEAFLVDRDGMVIVRSSEAKKAFTAKQYVPARFEYADHLPEDRRAGAAGWKKIVTEETTLQLMWKPLDAVDWKYVIVGERDELFAKAREMAHR